jgi:hypothetical protein
VFALERIDDTRADATDTYGACESAFRVCAQCQHEFKTAPNRDFR